MYAMYMVSFNTAMPRIAHGTTLPGATPMAWTRTCQEYGHKQTAKQPRLDRELSDSYRNSKCRACGSEALDYGSDPAETNPNWADE